MKTELSRDNIHGLLRSVGSGLLKKEYRALWSPERPTTGYCYLVSEILYHYQVPRSLSYSVNLGKFGVHWFVAVGYDIFDLTADQFDFNVPYGKARRRAFFKGSVKTERGFISKRAWNLKKLICE